jgi:hypothetical protein
VQLSRAARDGVNAVKAFATSCVSVVEAVLRALQENVEAVLQQRQQQEHSQQGQDRQEEEGGATAQQEGS